MKIENGVLKDIQSGDLTKDGWFIVKGNVLVVDEYAFYSVKSLLKKVVFENGCQVICCHAFDGCTNLTGVLLPQTLKEIGPCAFSETSIQRIDIPESVKKVENAAFFKCKSLKTVIFHGNVDRWKQRFENEFDGTLIFDRVFFGCKNIEKFVYHKKACFEPNYSNSFDYEWHEKAQIVVVNDDDALEFWKKSLKRNPLSYKFMDDARATKETYQSFRKECREVIKNWYAGRNPNFDVTARVNFAMKISRLENCNKTK